MTMEQPSSRVIRPKPNGDRTSRWDHDRISSGRIQLSFDKRRVYRHIVGSNIIRPRDQLELMPVKMEGVVSGVPVEH